MQRTQKQHECLHLKIKNSLYQKENLSQYLKIVTPSLALKKEKMTVIAPDKMNSNKQSLYWVLKI